MKSTVKYRCFPQAKWPFPNKQITLLLILWVSKKHLEKRLRRKTANKKSKRKRSLKRVTKTIKRGTKKESLMH